MRTVRRGRDSASARWRNSSRSDWYISLVAASREPEDGAKGSALRCGFRSAPCAADRSANHSLGRRIGRMRRCRAVDSLDTAQSAHAAPLRAARAALCQRLRRTRHDRLQPLDQDVDGGLCFRAGDLLERSRIRYRCHAAAAPRLRFCSSSANKPRNSSPTTTAITT